MTETLVLIDGHYQVYRSFFAFGTRPLTNSEGQRVESAYTVAQLLWRLNRELGPGGHWAFAMDSKTPTFRHESYPEYKANREKMPDELRQQLPWVEDIVRAFRIPLLRIDGFEADDVIATASTRAGERGWSVEILSKDKDLEQVLSDRVKLRREPASRDLYGPAELHGKRGIRPDQVVDYQALIGDSTDNIPGVPGIGPKTAIKILAAIEAAGGESSVERLLGDAPDGVPPAAMKKILNHPDELRVSRQLVTLDVDAPIASDLGDWCVVEPDLNELRRICLKLGFQKLLKELEAAVVESGGVDVRPEDTLFAFADDAPAAPAAPAAEAGEYALVPADGLEAWCARVRDTGRLTLATEPSGEVPTEARPRGVAMALESGHAVFVDLSDGDARPPMIERIGGLLADPAIEICGHDLKTQAQWWRSDHVTLAGYADDTLLAAYLLNPTSGGYRLDSLVAERFGAHRAELTAESTVDERVQAFGLDADFTARLAPTLREELEALELTSVYTDVELPLAPVLVGMERAGIRLDSDRLAEQEKELAEACADLETRIHEAAGVAFNIGSPKQLQEVLFEQLELEPIKKTKTGYSTSAEVLEELAVRHPEQPVPALVLEYRSLTKLLGTYISALPKLIHPDTGKLHTDLRQAVAATGRLASHRPNLQNIPIRTEVGRRIRRAFVPSSDQRIFLSADYSQIELRILAHYCSDPALREAMTEGGDIHLQVAARVHDKPAEEITREERSAAKAVTFGVIYGMGAFGLSRDLGIARKEAAEFIDRFFDRFPGVREFIDSTIADAHESGEVRTLLGRRRPLPELASRMQRDRKQGERFAVNTVIQGSAADLIKKAMIDVHRDLERDPRSTTLLLQIHDELLFELDRGDLESESERVRQLMESVLQLDVPLLVNMSSGDDWYDASK
ncbi:MAG: DNA polymerase I [Planctomycetota bacterium]